MPSTTLGIVGTGLIGSSAGLRGHTLGWHVIGYDADEDAAQRALRCGAIDEIVPREAVYELSNIVVLAAHLDGTLAELERLRCTAPARAQLIVDVASVKAPVVRAAAGISNFVATHPMAGAERSGADAARADLFVDKPWLYVAPNDEQLAERAVAFINAMAAIPIATRAGEHDAAVALTSHLPQVFAVLFAEQLKGDSATLGLDSYCGPAARELLRLSRSNVTMWREILLANRTNVAERLAGIAADLVAAASELRRGDTGLIEAAFERAQSGDPMR